MNQQGWMKVHHKRLLDKGKIEKRVLALRFYGIQQLPKSSRKFAPRRITLSGMVNVCVIQRMRYPKFRHRHLIVGSGAIEAGCKTVIGRLKRSGMFWTVSGANAIIALRCCHVNGRCEDYWESCGRVV